MNTFHNDFKNLSLRQRSVVRPELENIEYLSSLKSPSYIENIRVDYILDKSNLLIFRDVTTNDICVSCNRVASYYFVGGSNNATLLLQNLKNWHCGYCASYIAKNI